MQSKKQSRREAVANVVIGLIYAFLINYVLLKYPVFETAVNQAWWITFWFTLASLIRQYYMRRFFNWWDHRGPNTRD